MTSTRICSCIVEPKAGMELDKTCLVNRKKQRTVVMDCEEALQHPDMKAAMDYEIETFRKMQVYDEVDLCDFPTCTNKISFRWVLSTKIKPDGSTKCKARPVARGFEDLEKRNISRYSPTASNATRSLVLQILAEKQRVPRTWDFLPAFLQESFWTARLQLLHRLVMRILEKSGFLSVPSMDLYRRRRDGMML
jgi:hypothetical protein